MKMNSDRNAFFQKILQTISDPARSVKILTTLYLLIQFVIYLNFGVNTSNEAQKYIGEGTRLATDGVFSAPKYIFYLPMILMVACCRLLAIPVEWSVLGNLFFNAMATICFYRMIERVSNPVRAFWATFVLITFIPLQIWNWTLYTDSIFISLTTIYVWWAEKNSSKGIVGTLKTIAFLPILIIARPSGLLLIPPTIITILILHYQSKNRWIVYLICSSLIALMLYLLNFTFNGGGDLDAMKPFVEEHVICFVPLAPSGQQLDLLKNGEPLQQLTYYISHNLGHFLKLMYLKLISFFNLCRPYYSTIHNAFLAGWMTMIYLGFFTAVSSFYKSQRVLGCIISPIIVLYPLGSTFQCDDWHSRFTMVIIPFIILIAATLYNKQQRGRERALPKFPETHLNF